MGRGRNQKVPKQYTWNQDVFGIINHMGEPWTHKTFGTRVAATAYLDAQQAINPTWKLSKHRVVPVSVTVRAITTPNHKDA